MSIRRSRIGRSRSSKEGNEPELRGTREQRSLALHLNGAERRGAAGGDLDCVVAGEAEAGGRRIGRPTGGLVRKEGESWWGWERQRQRKKTMDDARSGQVRSGRSPARPRSVRFRTGTVYVLYWAHAGLAWPNQPLVC